MSVFQARHYRAIAELVKDSLAGRQHALFTAHEAHETVNAYVRVFQHDNPNFKPQLFIQACGLPVLGSPDGMKAQRRTV